MALIQINSQRISFRDPDLPKGYSRLKSIHFSGLHYETDYALKGEDTLKFTYSASTAGNVIGSYTGSTSQDNFSYYHTTQAYARYGTNLARPSMSANTIYECVFSPTGFTANGSSKATWTADTFTVGAGMWVGMLPNSSSASLRGDLYGDVEVVGKFRLIPCIRHSDGVVGYWKTDSEEFLEPQGDSGSVSAGEYDDRYF